LLTGLLEIGTGIGAMQGLAATPQNLALCAFLIGWGGVSVHCQTAAVLAGTTLKSARHTAGRFLHGVLSALLVLLFT
ncbi:MAG: sporulation protein, partial [Oscillospiraceae bacterium]|nr:sporulation protein [Oscillospiraceae bacterium]